MAEIETSAFKPVVNKLLNILNDKCPYMEIFLCKLIKNANFTLGMIRAKSELDLQPELFIRIIPDKTNNKTPTIVDSGIGMTKAVAFLSEKEAWNVLKDR